MNIVKEADVAAPPEKVYAYLLDFRRHSEWTTPGHVVQITPAAEGATAVGSVFESEGHQFGTQHDRLTVTELVPDRHIVYESVMKTGDSFRHTFELEPAPGGTHLRKRFQSLHLGLVSKLTAPLAGAFIAPKLLAGDLERIKANLERSAVT